MRKSLEEWLAKNFCPLIETTGTLVWDFKVNLNNKRRRIAVAFSRYHQVQEPWEYVVEPKGYVLVCPSFWLSIPKELVVFYIEYYIDGYLDQYVYNDGSSDTGDTGGNTGSCPVYPPCHPTNPGKYPPPPPPMPPCYGQPGNPSEGNGINIDDLQILDGGTCPVGCKNQDCELNSVDNSKSKFINTTTATNTTT